MLGGDTEGAQSQTADTTQTNLSSSRPSLRLQPNNQNPKEFPSWCSGASEIVSVSGTRKDTSRSRRKGARAADPGSRGGSRN